MSDKAIELFECLSCEEVWKSSYAPGHVCPECGTNNTREYEESNYVSREAYDAVIKDLDALKTEYNDLDLEFEQFRTRCPIPNIEVINENIKLRKELDAARKDWHNNHFTKNLLAENVKLRNGIDERIYDDVCKQRDRLLSSLKEAVEALKVISTNGENRGMGWTPAQHAVIEIAKLRERHGELK